MFFVYLLTNRANGKKYVGKARDTRKRWLTHRRQANHGSKQAIHAAIRKYGDEAFAVELLGEFETEREAFDAEKKFIAQLRTNVDGYNLTDGGEGCSGYKHTAESLKKMGDTHRGIPNTDEQKRKIAETLRGRVVTPEWRAKIAAARRGHTVSEETRAKISAALLGRKHSADARGKILAANRSRGKRRSLTEEERERLSAALRGKPWSAKRREAHEARKEK